MSDWAFLEHWKVTHAVENGPGVNGVLERIRCASGHQEIVGVGDIPPYCFQCEPERWFGDEPRTRGERLTRRAS